MSHEPRGDHVPEADAPTYDEVRARLQHLEQEVGAVDQRLASLRDVLLASVRSLQDLTDKLDGLDEAGHRADATTEAGETDAAQVFLGDNRSNVDIFHLASGGSSQMTVEVSNDGHEWYQKDQQSQTDASNIYEYDVPWLYVQAYADQSLGKIEISAKDV